MILCPKFYFTFQFSPSVVSNSSWSHELQHARPPCPSPAPGVYSNSCPSIRWCHPAISSSVVPFSSWPQSLPASGSFPMCQLFTWGGQSIGISASASVLPMNTQDWFPLGWTGWISLQSKGLSRVFSNTTVQKHQFFWNLWERAREGWYGRMALNHVNYHMWNELPVQVRCMIQDARGWCTGMTCRDGMGREVGRGFRMVNTCTPMVDSSQCMEKLIQRCKVK